MSIKLSHQQRRILAYSIPVLAVFAALIFGAIMLVLLGANPIEGYSEMFVGAFGPAIGLWAKFNNGAWTRLNGLSPELVATVDLDGNGQDEVVGDFGPIAGGGIGLWAKRNNGPWVRLNGQSPNAMASLRLFILTR